MEFKLYLVEYTCGFLYWLFFYQSMAKLKCNDYGFECDFVVEGEMEDVIDKFRVHTDDEHGIDYSKEAVMQFLLRKQGL
mgnify:CR=1 FL=1